MVNGIPNPSDVTVLIPAAGRAPEGILSLSNIASPAMIPVAGRPVIHWTMSYLTSLGLRRFVIAVRERGLFIEDFIDCTFGADCEVQFIVPTGDRGVGGTVLELAEQARTSAALVVLGDTHFRFLEPGVIDSEPFVLVSPVEESYRWCIAHADSDGYVTSLVDKQPEVPAPLEALIGVYYFPDTKRLRVAASEAAAHASAEGRRTEMSGILNRIGAQSRIRAVRTGDWLDCGNADRQASAHRALLQQRAFNQLAIDPVLGTLTKSSTRVEKFIDEINFFRLLPVDLAVLFPRLLAYSTDWNHPWMTMEYYGYPTLAEVFLFENVDPGIWERVFAHLRSIIAEGFLRHQRPLRPEVTRDMYSGKTRARLEELSGPPELIELVHADGPVRVNGVLLRNLPELWPLIDAQVERLAATGTGALIHGDLCFSNILYDLRASICKLVDPRGSFGDAGIHGDPRYDAAKLYHSVYGLYEFISNDLFRVHIEGRSVELDIRARPQHAEICRRFEKLFFPLFDRAQILLITGLLFASMPSLHYDSPLRQTAMYVRALQLLNEAFESLT